MSSSESFYWFDYETSGAEVSKDRPLQFAGLRTDADLNPVGEPLVRYCRPTPDYLPAPAAIRITGISPFKALEEGVAERDFIAEINREFLAPGTCGVGYNSIRFDDEITRYALYRNFFDPYARERGLGRSRWDLIDVTRAIAALAPEGIEWPRREGGGTSFRLEELTAANDIAHGSAHDALSDVEATIGLARLLKQRQPELFQTLFQLRTKQAVSDLIDINNLKPLVHVSGMFGADRHCLAVVVPVAIQPGNSNEVICVDLGQEPDFLFQDVTDIQRRLFSKSSELAEGDARPPLKTLRLNRAPAVLPVSWVAGPVAERLGLDGDIHRRSLAAIRGARDADPEGFRRHIHSIYAGRGFPPRSDPDQMLYDGFFGGEDKRLIATISASAGEVLQAHSWPFEDKRLPELLFRYRARNFPETLTRADMEQWREHCRFQISPEGPFPLEEFEAALTEEQALPDLSPQQRDALVDLARYAEELQQSLCQA